MYKVCGLPLDSIFRMRMTAGKNFYLRLTVEKMPAFAIITEKYLRSYDRSEINFTASVNCKNPRTEI